MSALYILFENATGYSLFSVLESEAVALQEASVQSALADDFGVLQRSMRLVAVEPFELATSALQAINSLSDHHLSPDLRDFLSRNMPGAGDGAAAAAAAEAEDEDEDEDGDGKKKRKKKKKDKKKRGNGAAAGDVVLGVLDPALGNEIQESMGITVQCDEQIRELTRAIRAHFSRFLSIAEAEGLVAQRGLAHAYSRAKVKFNPARQDNNIIQAIALLDQLDKDLNTFAMRVKEWYSWHFPELRDIVPENYMFARCAAFIRDRKDLDESKLEGLTEITLDEELSARILQASRSSMGMECTNVDMANISTFTERMVRLAEYRQQLFQYLQDKMSVVAPNLATLIGEVVGARLIQKAGSLTSLAKCPASTIQILGAEKALFRALKTRGNTPKYGLIYHSSFIGSAATKNKGRISRYLANKCAIASRVDSFSDQPTSKYGEQLREQVEERLRFYDTGETPRKNIDVMRSVADSLGEGDAGESSSSASAKKSKKRNRDEMEAEAEAANDAEDDDDDDDEDDDEDNSDDESAARAVDFGKLIRSKLKKEDNRSLKVKQLCSRVMKAAAKQAPGASQRTLQRLFDENLPKTKKVRVDGNVATLG